MKRRQLLTAAALGSGRRLPSVPGSESKRTTCWCEASQPDHAFAGKWSPPGRRNFPRSGETASALRKRCTPVPTGAWPTGFCLLESWSPARKVFDAVSSGTAELGHKSAAYYWKGKSPAAPFFTAVPLAWNAQENETPGCMGRRASELWQKAYARMGVLPLPVRQ